MERTPIGIVGLGLVGQSLGERLRSAGWPTLGFDLRAEAVAAFRQAGGSAAASVRELGTRCDCVLLAVFDTHGVIATVESQDGLLAPGHRVRTVIDCSTGSPELLEPLAQRLRNLGVDFIEAPLSGSSRQIAAGEATLLIGGESDAIARCDEVLDAIATRRIHAGSAGMGAKAKLATNLVLGLNRAALAEGMVFAQALGIEPERFLAMVLATPARSDAAQIKGPLMVRGDFAPQSRIRQHLKDVDLMLQSAGAAGLPLPLSQAHAELMRDAIAAGDGDLDNAAIIRQLRRAGGMPQ
jgi:3-hydroxyisobutyrate dehydrogenase-like beta-hydroxyacid dehydrogenase